MQGGKDMSDIKPIITIIDDYLKSNEHLEDNQKMVDALKVVFESDRQKFMEVIFSTVSIIGRERMDFAMEMMLTWIKGKIVEIPLDMAGAFGGGDFKES